ncbi:MAG TPA: DUF4870 domain-containing protein [Steroidobacteraceae bacterium]|nr:DUF4870 domain-containing protein [Steroidobacteraceae bacterium]
MNVPGPPESSHGAATRDERNVAMLAHLSALAGLIVPLGNILAPLVIWLAQREKSVFVADQALESLNFNITVILASIVCGALVFVGIGVLLWLVLGIVWLVSTILAAVRASEGQRFRHRFTLRLVH